MLNRVGAKNPIERLVLKREGLIEIGGPPRDPIFMKRGRPNLHRRHLVARVSELPGDIASTGACIQDTAVGTVPLKHIHHPLVWVFLSKDLHHGGLNRHKRPLWLSGQ